MQRLWMQQQQQHFQGKTDMTLMGLCHAQQIKGVGRKSVLWEVPKLARTWHDVGGGEREVSMSYAETTHIFTSVHVRGPYCCAQFKQELIPLRRQLSMGWAVGCYSCFCNTCV